MISETENPKSLVSYLIPSVARNQNPSFSEEHLLAGRRYQGEVGACVKKSILENKSPNDQSPS
jgi:hypothetical protein